MKKDKVKVAVVKNKFKIEKTEDYLIIWKRDDVKDEWMKWQNIHKNAIKNFDKLKIKGGN